MPLKPPFARLPAFDPESGDLNVIVDTPKGSRNKFEFDEERGLFKLGGVLPAGAVFPYDFGFVPATLGGDGDPIDVLILMDEPAFVGCLVESRLIGVIEAEQTEEGDTVRNDRLIAVSTRSRNHKDIREVAQFNQNLLAEIQHFFVSYNDSKGKRFEPLGLYGAERAGQLVEEGGARYRASRG
ncbi:inorganic diphosphatase [Paludisphaera mucosa]|uniref:inorganic diphosphatase n=1 Tax=Paludisphaera mucosa TaxID=3030827 RepID=A0ABT6FF21_9BACT|nr:inorganic diphosphatase [Paludisphaera mucosa]